MHYLHLPHPAQPKDNMIRACIAVISLIIVSGVTGSSLQVRLSAWMHQHAITNSSEYLSFTAPIAAQQIPSQDTVNALTAVQIGNLQQEAQANRDDRKAIHDQIYQLSQTETQHYNSLVDRLDVDEARVSGGVLVIGGLLTVLQGYIALSHFLTWKEKKRLQTAP